jgi:type II secretory pathway component PulJ
LKNKVQSFTLSELLIVMVITAIIISMAFSVLRLVQKQIHTIRKNFDKTGNLALFEQKLCQDFNEFNQIEFHANEKYLRMEK